MEEKKDFKHKEVNQLWDDFNQAMKDQSLVYYKASILELYSFINAYKSRYDKLGELKSEDLSNYAHLRTFKTNILDLLHKSQAAIINYNYQFIENDYYSLLKKEIATQKKTIRVKEAFDGYTLKNKANIPLFFQKSIGNIKLSLVKSKKKFYNIFRKVFRKTPLDLRSYRSRKIPFQSMIYQYLGPQYVGYMMPLLNELLLAKSQVLMALWEFDEALEERLQNSLQDSVEEEIEDVRREKDFLELFLAIEKKIKDLDNKLTADTDQALLKAFFDLDEAVSIIDTPDLSTGQFRGSILQEKYTQSESSYNSELKRWENTHNTLLDDWTVDVELMLLYFSVMDDFAGLHSQIDEYISNNLSLNLEALREFINTSSENIEKNAANAKELKKVLKEERQINATEFVDKLLAKTIHRLSGNINNDINAFKTKTMNLVTQLSDKRGFVKNKNYERGLKSSDISWLSPRDLLNFEALPHFNDSIEEVEQFVHQHLEKSRVKLLALGTVSDFSLESAQMMLQNKKGAIKGSVQVVVEGYARALVHLDEAAELMDKIKVEPLENLQLAINNFNSEIQKLKNTDNVLELNMKIVKIRAIERSKRIRKEAWEWIVNFIPKSLGFLKEQFENTNTQIIEIKKKLGILTEKPHISHELSDFLTKTEQSLKKLPFVYQRLYQLTPTDEDRFFVDRKKELESLDNAFEDWQKDRFITTAIVGEKGSGITSLILYFLKKNEIEIPIIHQEIGYKIFDRQDYYQFFAELLNQDSFKSNDEIITYLNNQKGQLVIILENLQHLYLKKVNGFVCQKMFFDMMTSTSKKVFWISTYTTHSWEYLDKTLNITSIFTKEVHLEKLNETTIEEIIFKRNYLSGYRVDFEPSESILSSKSYAKLNEKEKQGYLKKSFFKDLQQMSNGNVSLAQLYWLRSTHGISDDALNISSLRDFDVSFNKELPSSYLFALHAILVHDGLSIENYAEVFNTPEYICRNDLIPMLEKGLLMKPKEKYNINPIIFRQVVDLLRSHNFIN